MGWERVGTAFPHVFLAWERVPTPFNDCNVTWRCGIHKIILKHGCDFTDGLATRKFSLLVKSLHSGTKKSGVEILVGECSLYSNCLAQLFGTAFPHLYEKVWENLFCGNGVPTPLFLALHSCWAPIIRFLSVFDTYNITMCMRTWREVKNFTSQNFAWHRQIQ